MGGAEGEYGYRRLAGLPIAMMVAGSLVVVIVAPIMALWVALERWDAFYLRAEGLSVQVPSPWWYGVPLLLALLGAAALYSGIRRGLLDRRAGIVIGDSFIAVRDWLGLEQEWPWDRVVELRCGHDGHSLPFSRACLELRDSRRRKLQVNHGFSRIAHLRQAAIDRARLTQVECTWWGERWTRPPESEADDRRQRQTTETRRHRERREVARDSEVWVPWSMRLRGRDSAVGCPGGMHSS